jgi:hypothetical protein
VSAHTQESSEHPGSMTNGWSAARFMGSGLGVALALTAVAFIAFGARNEGTVVALKLTARWSFLWFWLAYVASALAKLFGHRFDGLARQGRELGLAFAAAQLAHVGLILWLFRISNDTGDLMSLFWIGILCTYLVAIFSFVQLRESLVRRTWWFVRTVAIEYIAFVFAIDFIVDPLRAQGPGAYPWSYVPFAALLVGGTGLRVAAYTARIRRPSNRGIL